MKLMRSVRLIIIALSIVSLYSCSKEYETKTFPDSALVTIKLQGLSSSLSNANIDISDIQFQMKADPSEEDAWKSLQTVNMGVHDLVQVTGSQVVTLVDFDEIELGRIFGLKLILGDNNSVVKNGVSYDLIMNTDAQNEVINIVDKDIVANMLYEFIVEFDIEASVQVSQGAAYLNPQTSLILRRFELF